MEHNKINGMSAKLILNRSLFDRAIAITIGIIAIVNLRKSRVVESIPFWVNVRTNSPLDPNMNPAKMGKSVYILLIVILSMNKCSS